VSDDAQIRDRALAAARSGHKFIDYEQQQYDFANSDDSSYARYAKALRAALGKDPDGLLRLANKAVDEHLGKS
jgi:molybdate-binding protein